MRSLVAGLVLVGINACGSTHEVKGTAEVRHVFTVELEICNELPEEKKEACIEAMLEAMGNANKEEY